MIIKFVALAAFTAAGVGTVIALNAPEVNPESEKRSSVSVPAEVPTGRVGLVDEVTSPPRHGPGGPRGHERLRYVPPHAGNPSSLDLTEDGREFEGDWSEHEGWHGEWDDDVRRPEPRESRHPQEQDTNEQEQSR